MGFSFANNPPSPRKKKRKEMINVFFCVCVCGKCGMARKREGFGEGAWVVLDS
jgi:hypothetical protein